MCVSGSVRYLDVVEGGVVDLVVVREAVDLACLEVDEHVVVAVERVDACGRPHPAPLEVLAADHARVDVRRRQRDRAHLCACEAAMRRRCAVRWMASVCQTFSKSKSSSCLLTVSRYGHFCTLLRFAGGAAGVCAGSLRFIVCSVECVACGVRFRLGTQRKRGTRKCFPTPTSSSSPTATEARRLSTTEASRRSRRRRSSASPLRFRHLRYRT